MAIVGQLIIKLWWLLLAMIPLALWRLIDQLNQEINCPRFGDCYNPGWWAAYHLDLWTTGIAVLIWPVCLWNLGGRWLSQKIFK